MRQILLPWLPNTWDGDSATPPVLPFLLCLHPKNMSPEMPQHPENINATFPVIPVEKENPEKNTS